MNAQIISENNSPFFVSVAGFCGLDGEFYEEVPLKNVTTEGDVLKINGIACGKISEVKDTKFVTLNRYHCFFQLAGRNTYLSTYSYQGGGELISKVPQGPIRYVRSHRIILDEANVPTVIFGYNWDRSTKTFEEEISRFRSVHLRYKEGEVFYQNRPCGRFIEDDNMLRSYEDLRRYNNCQIHYESNGNIYLLPHAPWIENSL
jgi:hypothetical protein